LQIIAKRLLESKNGIPPAYLQSGQKSNAQLVSPFETILLSFVPVSGC